MRTIVATALIGLLTSNVLGHVSARVYHTNEATPLPWADPNIPDVYQDIMVGTRLTLFIGSDIAQASSWSGGLWLSWEDWDKGVLAGRGYDAATRRNDGSILPALGKATLVLGPLFDTESVRFTLNVDGGFVGEWIVLDYHAETIGTCTMGLYSYEPDDGNGGGFNPSIGELPPPASAHWLQGLTFNHVPSRDYNGDQIVDFADFAMLAGQWQGIAPADPNAIASPDLDANEGVDLADLTLFCEYWLDRADVDELEPEPNMPGTEP